MNDIENMRFFLEWLITPQDDKEQQLFREENLVDDYIELKNRIPTLTREELITEINIQLEPYGKQVSTDYEI